jgi:hypothetical protein
MKGEFKTRMYNKSEGYLINIINQLVTKYKHKNIKVSIMNDIVKKTYKNNAESVLIKSSK